MSIILAMLLAQVQPVTQVDPRYPSARPYTRLEDGGVAVSTYNYAPAGAAGGGLTDAELRASPVPVLPPANSISTLNSTSTPLGASASFTGTAEDVSLFAVLSVNSFSDVSGTLNLEWSSNSTNWDHAEAYPVTASEAFSMNASPRAKWFRIRYVNGGSPQAAFRLQAIFGTTDNSPRKTAVVNLPTDNDPSILTRSVIVGKTTAGGGAYVAVKVSPSGTVQVGGVVDQGSPGGSPWPVSGPLTDAQLRATPVPVSGTVTASGPLTDAQLRATPVPVSGTVTASGPLTDAQLRATPVPVSGTVTASGPLTDAQLRAAVVPVAAASTVATAVNPGACVSVSTSTTVLASNASRRGASVCARISNTDTAHLKLGATATTANFPLEPGQCLNLQGGDRVYTGVMDAIAASGTQSVCVVELN